MNISLERINKELYEIGEEYKNKYMDFKVLELDYMTRLDKLLLEAQSIFTNQPSREAYARQEIQAWSDFNKFYVLQCDISLLTTRMRNLQVISKNLVSASWSVS